MCVLAYNNNIGNVSRFQSFRSSNIYKYISSAIILSIREYIPLEDTITIIIIIILLRHKKIY